MFPTQTPLSLLPAQNFPRSFWPQATRRWGDWFRSLLVQQHTGNNTSQEFVLFEEGYTKPIQHIDSCTSRNGIHTFNLSLLLSSLHSLASYPFLHVILVWYPIILLLDSSHFIHHLALLRGLMFIHLIHLTIQALSMDDRSPCQVSSL